MRLMLPLLLLVPLSVSAGTCDPDNPYCVDVSEFLVQESLLDRDNAKPTQRIRISPEAASQWFTNYRRKQEQRETFSEALRQHELWRDPVRCRRTFGTVTCR